ncbi:hypothetical protein [Microlunatus parietis]|uniref:Uncharacterized protein n=1 Tax=Microlunatus parietis TaxID=682979 RepID=A0A7Y9I9G7_9ACTN|nr:hypothetical protein [Microlunatus parietis]NYE72789.1 hypothetical protein [Microlunatus parietis]
MRVRLIGANPFLTLYRDGAPVAYASVWRVDWSERGAGHALVYGDAERVRVIGPDPDLGLWLAESYNRYFQDVCAGLPWHEPELIKAPVDWHLDLATGLRAKADDLEVEVADPIDRQLGRNDAYQLGEVTNILSTVWMPCRIGTIKINGEPVEGELKITTDPLYSSAAIADAEVWCWPE